MSLGRYVPRSNACDCENRMWLTGVIISGVETMECGAVVAQNALILSINTVCVVGVINN